MLMSRILTIAACCLIVPVLVLVALAVLLVALAAVGLGFGCGFLWHCFMTGFHLADETLP